MRLTSLLTLFMLSSLTLQDLQAKEQTPTEKQPISVLIVPVGVLSKEGIGKSTAIRISNPKKLKKLIAFFPRFAELPESNLAGAWEAGYYVYIDFPHGKSIRITVSADNGEADWTVGNGDFLTKGDFKAFVDGLVKE